MTNFEPYPDLGIWVRVMQDGAVPWHVEGRVRSYKYG